MEDSCITCGMPLEGTHANDIGLKTAEGPVCKFDVADGKVKEGGEIFKGGVEYFAGSVAVGDRALAERLTRKNMNMLPYWQERPFKELEGEEATDEEFADAMAKLAEK
jgi:hypothetical protein